MQATQGRKQVVHLSTSSVAHTGRSHPAVEFEVVHKVLGEEHRGRHSEAEVERHMGRHNDEGDSPQA